MTESFILFPQIHTSDIDSLLRVNYEQQQQQQQHLQQEQQYSQQQYSLQQYSQEQCIYQQPQQDFLYDPMLNCYFQPQRSTSTSLTMTENTIYPITPMPQHNLFYDNIPMLQPSPHSISQSSIGSPPSFHSECYNNQQQQNSIKPDFRSMMTPPEEYEIPLFFDTNQFENTSDQKNNFNCITKNQPPSQTVVDANSLSDQGSKRKSCVSNNKKDSACTSPPSPPSTNGSPSSIGSFQCDFPNCTKTFTRTYNLKSHYRTHTDERPFKCTKCPKSFARQHDRNRHEKLHGGSKPYLCEYCEKGFARQDALNRHLKRDKKNRDLRKNDSSYSDHTVPPCMLMKIQRHPTN